MGSGQQILIHHYDRLDAIFYLDPSYFSTEGMYDVDFGWDDHVQLRDTLLDIKGKLPKEWGIFWAAPFRWVAKEPMQF